MESLVIL